MHLLVLSAFRHEGRRHRGHAEAGLNAPFGAQCFPTSMSMASGLRRNCWVSMHLLVLSAFRRIKAQHKKGLVCLNAPFGAQCFPTMFVPAGHTKVSCLNAPFGAQCFPTFFIEMFDGPELSLNAPFGAQCFPTKDALPSEVFV